MVGYIPHPYKINCGRMLIENELHEISPCDEKELYSIINKYVKGKQNEKRKDDD